MGSFNWESKVNFLLATMNRHTFVLLVLVPAIVLSKWLSNPDDTSVEKRQECKDRSSDCEDYSSKVPCERSKQWCCATCRAKETGNEDCPYGDVKIGHNGEWKTCEDIFKMGEQYKTHVCGLKSKPCCASCNKPC